LFSATPGDAWVLTDAGLLRTQDRGVHWAADQVPNLSAARVQAIDFVDHSGWLVSLDELGTGLQLTRTQDSGGTWTEAPLPGQFPDGIAGVAIDALDDMNIWITIKMPFSAAESIGYALASHDGGRSWSSISLPNGDPVDFRTSQDGWQAGGPVNQYLSRSQDGGKTWQPVDLPIPEKYKDHRVAFANPIFFGLNGVLPVSLNIPGGGPLVVAFFTSKNAGDDWSLTASIEAAPDGSTVPLAVASQTAWVVETSKGLESTSDGLTFAPVGESGMSPSSLISLAADGSALWATVGASSCPAGKSSCVARTLLERSTDGGRTWSFATP
jgi:hypothetical protein